MTRETLAALCARVQAKPGALQRLAALQARREAADAKRAAQLAAFGAGPFAPADEYRAIANRAGLSSQECARVGAYSLARSYAAYEDRNRALSEHVRELHGEPAAAWVQQWREATRARVQAKPVPLPTDTAARLHTMAHDGEVRRWAAVRCEEAARLIDAAGADTADRYAAAADHWRRWGMDPPELTTQRDLPGVVRRMACPDFWRRRARQVWAQAKEYAAICDGNVNAKASHYVSAFMLAHTKARRDDTRRMLEAMAAVADDGESVQLSLCVDASPANPKVRRAEMMAQVKGTEDLAEYRGDAGVFLTLTAPSQFHAMRHSNGRCERNPKWNGCTPTDAQRYLAGVWDGAVREARGAGIRWYGLRAVQPHHDACPHWHCVLWCEPARMGELCAIIRRHALLVDGDEPGADVRRCDVKLIDRERGTATGYAIRYIARAIDGAGLDVMTERDDAGQVQNVGERGKAADMVARVVAWASVWRIRLFQFIGTPPKIVQRELRRVRDEVAPHWALEEVRKAADGGDWREYSDLMAGPNTPRKLRPVVTLRAPQGEPNRYGEPRPDSVKGVQLSFDFWDDPATPDEVRALAALPVADLAGNVARVGYRLAARTLRQQREDRRAAWADTSPRVITRRRRWRLVPLRTVQAAQFAAPWTRVNNCSGASAGAVPLNDARPPSIYPNRPPAHAPPAHPRH